MAFTVAKIKESVVGDMRFQILSCTADAATQVIDTGLDYIYGASFAPQSMASSPWSIRVNESAAGTSTVGSIGVTGVASGDVFYLTVWGR
jgi:hypothetical protein